jgi:hypothetical protein
MNKSLQLSSLLPLVCLDSCNLPLRTRVTTNDLGEWPHARFLSHPPFLRFYSSDTHTSNSTRIQITLCTSCKYEVRINAVETSLSFCRALESAMTLGDTGDVITRRLCWKQECDKQKRAPTFFFHGTRAPSMGQGPLIIEASRSHSGTPHSSGRVISSSQRPLPDNTQN